jgi:hypothetical protein
MYGLRQVIDLTAINEAAIVRAMQFKGTDHKRRARKTVG